MELSGDTFLGKVLHIVVPSRVVSIDEVRVPLVDVSTTRTGGSNLITLECIMAREAYASEAEMAECAVDFGRVVGHCRLL